MCVYDDIQNKMIFYNFDRNKATQLVGVYAVRITKASTYAQGQLNEKRSRQLSMDKQYILGAT